MSEQMYKWKRFWCHQAGRINLNDGGYVCNPDEEFGKSFNPNLVTFKSISHLSCLALLGEPGIGKSKALEIEQKEEGNDLLFLDLRQFGSEDRLAHKLFESQKFKEWHNGTHDLYIFLDSLDECLLRIDTVATLLVDEFKEYKNVVNRLYLRIVCRTAVWPTVLEEGLKKIWDKNSVGVYELVPLRRIDVIEAAKAEGFFPDNFLMEVYKKNLVSLAIKPVSLNFLLEIYRKHNGQFPPNLKPYKLYLEGCQCLCQEVSPSRRSSERKGNLEIEQRLIVAARIAAITILSNRFAVWTGEIQNTPTEDIFFEKLCYGHETANGREFEITGKVIKEVLDTGLFSSRGLERMGWAHQTYAEFLAAWYLFEHKIPPTQIIELFFSPEDPNNKLIPQLHETSAWLASMRKDIFEKIIETDPDVLLRMDVPTDDHIRLSIVAGLLTQCEEEKKSFQQLIDYYHSYEKLKHPQLTNQLRPYIWDTKKQIDVDVRELAIYIAEACQVSELQEDLVNLALDSSQSVDLRASAANALATIGSIETRRKLKPLAVKQLPEDKNDQLKGYALKALWPNILSAQELFETLTSCKQINVYGGYQNFLDELIKQLKLDDLVLALDWLADQGVRHFGHSFERLGNNILLKAWENFDFLGVAKGFAKCALVQWKEYRPVITDSNCNEEQFVSSVLANSRKRRILIEEVVSISLEIEEYKSNRLPFYWIDYNPAPEDTIWFLEKLQNSDCEKTQRIWGQLLKHSFDCKNVKHLDILCTAYKTHKILKEVFSSYFEAVELDSSQAQKSKENYLRTKKLEQDDSHNPPLLCPPPKERVLQVLENLEDGDLSAWSGLNMAMTLNPQSTHYANELELDLTKLPGWENAEDATRRRIIEGAKKYIYQQDDIPDDWIGTNTFNRLALAGCRALLLLSKENPDSLNQLSSERWQKWTPAIIASPHNNKNEESYLEIVKYAYQNAPDTAINTLMSVIDTKSLNKTKSQNNTNHYYMSEIDLFAKCWDKRLKLALLEKVKEDELTLESMRQLIREILRHECTEAREWAMSIISLPQSSIDTEYKKQLIIASVLIQYSDSCSLSLICEKMQQNSAWGRDVLELAFEHISSLDLDKLDLKISEKQLADLYIWLVCQYPCEKNLDHSNEVMAHWHCVTPRERIGDFRDSVLVQLREYGTSQSCLEIQRLIQELPELPWLRKTLIQAQNKMRQKTWQPLIPEDILQLIFNKEKRLVQNGHQLLEVLIESLDRLELELQGETAAARDVWDGYNKDAKSFTPIDENAFSDYVKRFLDRDLKSRGIVINREVELRRSYGGNPGERTDIHIDAILKQPNGQVYDSITVIIEVKGCWHSDLKTAMKNQLVERYLADNTDPYGLYLVGWFDCQQWDEKDSRKKKTPRWNIDEATRIFNQQAEQLSSLDIVVRSFVLNTALR